MGNRKQNSLLRGTISEKRFARHLEGRKVDFTIEVGTKADVEDKIDFIVKGLIINVKSPTYSGPPGLCVEWRAVDGSTGWLHKIDYVVKFVTNDVYWRIPCDKLKDLVVETRGKPSARCPQTGATRSNGAWYARADWEGKDRTGEACIIIPLREIRHLAKVIKT
jgi:hypothetical protein